MRPVVLVCILFWNQSRNEGGNGFFVHFQYKLLQDIIFKISKSNFRKTKLKFKIPARKILDIDLFYCQAPFWVDLITFEDRLSSRDGSHRLTAVFSTCVLAHLVRTHKKMFLSVSSLV